MNGRDQIVRDREAARTRFNRHRGPRVEEEGHEVTRQPTIQFGLAFDTL